METRLTSGTEYDLLKLSPLLRLLLLDQQPLLHLVNRQFRLPVSFVVGTDPAKQIDPAGLILACPGTIDPLPGDTTTYSVPLKSFLQLPVLVMQGHLFTVADIIRYEANIQGGVHCGDADSKQKLLQCFAPQLEDGTPLQFEIRFGDLWIPAPFSPNDVSKLQLRGISRVVLRALATLRKSTADSRPTGAPVAASCNPITIIVAVTTPSQLAAARSLFAEYASSIESIAACSLQHQRFTDELANLPGAYAPPRGCILLAFDGPTGDEAIGCVALRPLDGQLPRGAVCELKRMFVRPSHRGRGIGRRLCEATLVEAGRLGYSLMKLDTSHDMPEALGLYRALGFVECPRYNDDPQAGTVWMERPLREQPVAG